LLPGDIVTQLQVPGYAIVSTSDAVETCMQSVVATAFEFFRLSGSQKLPNHLPHDLGYRPFAAEYSRSPENRDQVESFSASAKYASLDQELSTMEAKRLYGRMIEVVSLFEVIAEEIVIRLASEFRSYSFGESLRGATKKWSFLQINYSKPNRTTRDLINDLHEDGCLITLLSATGPGLELQTAKGAFDAITPARNQLLVIPGEIAWLLSGGRIPQLYHRVKSDPRCDERISLLYFADLDPRMCEPWIFNHVNNGCDIGSRVLSNPRRFGLDEWKME